MKWTSFIILFFLFFFVHTIIHFKAAGTKLISASF